jgi:hypothetical protein
MILEFLISTTLQELITRNFKPKHKNNKQEIHKLINADCNDVRTVGELREILKHFADDVSMGNSYEWHHVQVRTVNGMGSLNIGKVQTWGN